MASATATATPIEALVQQQLAAAEPKPRRWPIVLAVAFVLALVAAGVWYFFIRKRPPPVNPSNPADCNPPCTGTQVCIDKVCKDTALSCTTDAQCGTCTTCVAGVCTPKASCCGGVTCAAGQTCDTKTNTCVYTKGYCDANRACPPGSACDPSKNTCIAQPPYGPDSGKGCFEGFGAWIWELDPKTNSGTWRCRCANPTLYNSADECSPLARSTLCAAENLDPNALTPASSVPAFAAYGWANQPVLINKSTAGAAVPSPLAGTCPCKPGWAGGSCTEDRTCNGRGTWNETTGQCACNIDYSGYGNCQDDPNCTSWTAPNCARQCAVSGAQCVSPALPCCDPRDRCGGNPYARGICAPPTSW
ncbi:Flil-like domain-containing protein [Pandoravirus kuranda]|uniref:Flil-like domain-containing protein n=1 Tax=Pandoravirus kuranda TaxID=3019033 RepID=A0AA95EN22_9VIRU|nr:Flil-like domain-containing protein [Pandoravirus kuranda]